MMVFRRGGDIEFTDAGLGFNNACIVLAEGG